MRNSVSDNPNTPRAWQSEIEGAPTFLQPSILTWRSSHSLYLSNETCASPLGTCNGNARLLPMEESRSTIFALPHPTSRSLPKPGWTISVPTSSTSTQARRESLICEKRKEKSSSRVGVACHHCKHRSGRSDRGKVRFSCRRISRGISHRDRHLHPLVRFPGQKWGCEELGGSPRFPGGSIARVI